MEYDNLFTILERGRNVARRVLVASSPLYQKLDKAEEAGYEVSILERVGRQQRLESSMYDAITASSDTSIATSTSSISTGSVGHQASGPGKGGKEQCVDELLHLKILESLLEYNAPATLVLASGDGKDAEYFQGGFHKCILMALERGWKVEVISWKQQLSGNFLERDFMSKWEGKYHVVLLDWFAMELGCDM